ncbi:STAS domain-containing protein [Streptacidiphilus neutrinimicus]|uniref:STAS domain-containing protein n=1 Tax=Streptacidiphilus neutrinimicus TaxID=105420 RepID=UPI0006945988|nr:STAS domain-containing protein [Streptacidiphilus neutrinimicus]
MSEPENTPAAPPEADRLTVAVRTAEEAGYVLLAGELDPDTAPEVALATGSLMDAGVTRIVLDCSRLGFCDSSGLNVLLRARQQVSDVGGRLVLAAPTRQLLRLLELTGALSVFETQPDVACALAEA